MALTKIPANLLDTTGHVDLLDNEQIRLGTSQDMLILHDGNHSLIDDAGDGSLILRSDTSVILRKRTGDENMLVATPDAAVTLYHNNSAKLATSAAGASITGDLTVTGDLNITGDVNSASVTDLDVVDKTITLGKGQVESASGGSGIVIDGSGASFTWDETNDRWLSNKKIALLEDVIVNANAGQDVNVEVGAGTTQNHYSYIDLIGDATYTDYGLRLIRNNGGANTSSVIHHRGTGSLGLRTEEDAPITFSTKMSSGGSEIMRIAGNGSVGIGMTGPSTTYKLDVAGSIRSSGNSPSFNLREDDSSNQHWQLGSYGGVFALRNVTGGTYPLQSSGGQVGIGMAPDASKNYALDIQATTGGNALRLRGRNAGGNEGWLAWTDYAGNVEAAMYATANQLIFANTTSYTTTMTIDGSGDVYIPGAITTGSSSNNPGQIIINDGGSSAYTLKIYGTGTRAYEFRGSDSGADYNTTFSNHNTGNHNLIADGSIKSTTNAALALDLAGTHSNGNYMRFAKGGAVQHYIGSSDSVGGGSGYYDYYSIAGIGQRFWAGASERMRINASGCIGLGTTADRSLGTNITTTATSGSAGSGFWMSTGNSSATSSKIWTGTNGSVGELYINQGSGVNGGSIIFSINDSRKLTLASNGRLFLMTSPSGSGALNIMGEVGNSYDAVQFYHTNTTVVGRIRTAASSTSYITSSDYRLKENINYTWDATTRLKQLKPARFNWIADTTNTLLEGFIAHEVSSVVPEAITGEKDGTETYKDAEGNEQTRPEYQGIDHSKLVPLMVKTIQELEARIATLEG